MEIKEVLFDVLKETLSEKIIVKHRNLVLDEELKEFDYKIEKKNIDLQLIPIIKDDKNVLFFILRYNNQSVEEKPIEGMSDLSFYWIVDFLWNILWFREFNEWKKLSYTQSVKFLGWNFIQIIYYDRFLSWATKLLRETELAINNLNNDTIFHFSDKHWNLEFSNVEVFNDSILKIKRKDFVEDYFVYITNKNDLYKDNIVGIENAFWFFISKPIEEINKNPNSKENFIKCTEEELNKLLEK